MQESRMTAPSESVAIEVVGDVIVDRHFYHSDDGIIEVGELGGAAGLARLLHEAIDASKPPSPFAARLGLQTPDRDKFPPSGNAYAVWAPYSQTRWKNEPKVWRAIRPMGYGSPDASPTAEFGLKRTDGLPPRILVLDDGGFDFRQPANKPLWRLPAESAAKPDWIILKTSGPVAQGELWHELKRLANRLICIVSANELRDECVVLGRGASWESARGRQHSACDEPGAKRAQHLPASSHHLLGRRSTVDRSDCRGRP
jgi:hypothetical protein